MKNRLIGLGVALVLVITSLVVCAAVPAAAADVTVTVGSVTGQVGDVVEVPVSISEGHYLVNADMVISFDPAKLALVDTHFADPDGEEGGTLCYQVNTALFNSRWMYVGNEKTPGNFVFAAATGANTGVADGGEMFRLAFKILSEDADGAQITFSADPLCGNDGSTEAGPDGYPVDYDVAYTAVAGVVTVGEETTTTTTTTQPAVLRGDVNGDGKLNIADAMQLFASVSGKRTLPAERQEAADYDGNGKINIADAMKLFAKVSGK